MKKIYSLLLLSALLTLGAGNAWAGDDDVEYVVGCATTNASNYSLKLGVGVKDWAFQSLDMSEAKSGDKSLTFEGKKLYVRNYYTKSDKNIGQMKFMMYDGSDWKEEKAPYDNWTTLANNYYPNYIFNYEENSFYGQVTIETGARLYFDATGWSETAIKMCVGHANYQGYYDMTAITNTKLYYGNPGSKWTDAMGFGVVGNTDRVTGVYWLTDVPYHAAELTGFKNKALSKTDEGYAYLMVNGGKAGQEPTVSENASFLTLLNSAQTIKFKVCDNTGVYQEVTSGTAPATITIGSYKFATGTYNAVSAANASASASTYSASVDAARTATTTLGYSDVVTGYEFVGWYDADGNELASTTIYPTEAKTYYAYFRPTTYSRSIANGAWGTICLPYNVAADGHDGLDIFSIYSVDSKTNPSVLYLAAEDGDLVAGQPYIFNATKAVSQISLGSTIVNTAGNNNGLIGVYEAAHLGEGYTEANKWYVISGGQVKCAAMDCLVNANRAYINLNYTNEGVPSAPGRRIVEMPMAPENATALEDVESNVNVVKFFENGQLYIRKDGVVYDVMGRVVR